MTSWSLELMDFKNVSILEIVRQGLFCSHISFCLFVGTSQLSLMSWVTESMLCLIELRLVIWPWENNTFAAIGGKKNSLPLLASTSLWKSYWEFQWSAAKCNFKTWNWKLWCCTEAKVCDFFFFLKVSLFQIQTCKICQVKEGNDGDNF